MTAELKLIDVYLKYQVLDAQNRSLKQTLLNKMVGGNINRVHDKVSEISSLNGSSKFFDLIAEFWSERLNPLKYPHRRPELAMVLSAERFRYLARR